MNRSALEDLWTVVRLAAEGSDWKRDQGEPLSAWAQRRLSVRPGSSGQMTSTERNHLIEWHAGLATFCMQSDDWGGEKYHKNRADELRQEGT